MIPRKMSLKNSARCAFKRRNFPATPLRFFSFICFDFLMIRTLAESLNPTARFGRHAVIPATGIKSKLGGMAENRALNTEHEFGYLRAIIFLVW